MQHCIDVNRINRQELSNVGGFCRPGSNSNDDDDDDDINYKPSRCLSANALDLHSECYFGSSPGTAGVLAEDFSVSLNLQSSFDIIL